MKRVVFPFLLLALSACQTKPIEALNYTELRQLADVIAKRCLEQGVKPNTRQMEQCIQAEINAEQYNRHQNRQRQLAMADSLAETGAQMQANAAANRPVNCNSTQGYGGTVRTTCY